uniref:THH1/TOM1/TOM3 domain-containing protein n=1 Tax=Nelumbo nucifera TaxID=4432 RepID=A0A822YIF5_NELNU|nr:TPA_asm: hypothetical protein HUJ06_009557 [Nelumbo nucifera]
MHACFIFYPILSISISLSFLLYGGRLFFMLRCFPIESKGYRKKLHEVGFVTAIYVHLLSYKMLSGKY